MNVLPEREGQPFGRGPSPMEGRESSSLQTLENLFFFDHLPLRILPRFLIKGVFIPQEYGHSMVFLDNEPTLCRGWEVAAKKRGLPLLSTPSFETLKKALPRCDPQTIFYIDYDLGEKGNGLTICRWLWERGFRQLYLATGHPPQKMRKAPFLKGIVGKSPPWAKEKHLFPQQGESLGG